MSLLWPVESHQEYIREVTEEYDEKLRLEQLAQKKLYNDKGILEIEFDTLKKQIDDDADDEMGGMKQKYAQRLKLEEDSVRFGGPLSTHVMHVNLTFFMTYR